jgi:hypothetical protein
MTKQEIIDYLYDVNCYADYTIEDIAEDLATPCGRWKPYMDDTYICTNCLRKANGMVYRIDHLFCKDELSSFCPYCGG